jgi:hypothetical protein
MEVSPKFYTIEIMNLHVTPIKTYSININYCYWKKNIDFGDVGRPLSNILFENQEHDDIWFWGFCWKGITKICHTNVLYFPLKLRLVLRARALEDGERGRVYF